MPDTLLRACIAVLSLLSLVALGTPWALAASPLDRAEAASTADDPARRYPVFDEAPSRRVVYEGRDTARDPRVYAFEDACRGDVAHFVVPYRSSDGRRAIAREPGRLLGAPAHPKAAIGTLPAWQGVRAAVSEVCPTATAVLLSETFQVDPRFAATADRSVKHRNGMVQQRFALALDDPDGPWRSVGMGGAATLRVGQSIFYETVGLTHAIGRSCGNPPGHPRRYCPGALRTGERETYICTGDETFCLVVPLTWCLDLGGRIGAGTPAKCIDADQRSRAVAGILHGLREAPSAEAALRGGAAERAERFDRIELVTRGSLFFSVRDASPSLSALCQVVEEPAGHPAAINAFGFGPAVFGVGLDELGRRRPDLVERAGNLCKVMNVCASLAFRDGDAGVMEVARRGLSSSLCRSHDDADAWRMNRVFADLARAIDTLRDRPGLRTVLLALGLARTVADGHRLETVRDEMRGHLPALEALVLDRLGWSPAAVAELIEGTRR